MRFILPLLLISFLACHPDTVGSNTTEEKIAEEHAAAPNNEWLRFKTSVDSMLPILNHNTAQLGMNRQWALLANLGIHSGLPRMALINLKDGSIADSGCVAHGYGDQNFSERAVYSNTPGSYCSSIGKYRIGNKYKGNFGWSYKLYGLDKSNSKAYERFIVLHSYEEVPETAPYPDYICNSQGCPMLSIGFLQRISQTIDAAEKPMMLWIIP